MVGYGPDGRVEIYSTGDPALAAAVRNIERASDRTVPVRIISGMTNSYADLRALQAQVDARRSEFRVRGIELANSSVDIRANRLSLGVIGVTTQQRDFLEAEFGADRVLVAEGQRFTVASESPGC
jgi:hypothetical protein